MSFAKQTVLGIDIGGTNMRFGLVDAQHNITAFERISTRDTFAGDCDPTQKLVECIHAYCGRHLGGKLPDAVSAGFPSTIDHSRRIVLQTPNISCIPDNFPFVETMEKALGVAVFANRDVNNLLLYDLEDLQVMSQGCVLGIYFGTGIGNAIYLNGKFLLGRNGVAAEMGHLPVLGNELICNCGNKGCLETLVSGIALEALQKKYYPDTAIGQLFASHSEEAPLQSFVDGMGVAVASEVNLFDPDCVVIGGGLLQMSAFPRAALERAIHTYVRKPYPEQTLDVRYSRVTQENGAIGAGIYAFNRMADAVYL